MTGSNPYLAFYDSATRGDKHLIEDSIVNSPNHVYGPDGNLDLELEVALTDANAALLHSLEPNSHFVVFGTGQGDLRVAGIVEDCYINNNIAKIIVVGFKQLLQKIVHYSSDKIGSLGSNTVIRKDDQSHNKNFYSDVPEGILYALLRDLERSMEVKGFSKFWTYGNMRSFISDNTSTTWGDSYRLNSPELPLAGDIVSDVTDSDTISLLRVTFSEDDGNFIFNLNFSDHNPTVTLDEGTDPIWDITHEDSEAERSRYSMATGTNLSDQTIVSMIDFDESVLMTMSVVDTPSESVKSLASINESSMKKKRTRKGQVSFKSYRSDIVDLHDKVTIDSDHMPAPITLVIDEITLEGNIFTFTGTQTSASGLVKHHKTSSEYSRGTYTPLAVAAKRAQKSSFSRPGTTGWRTVS